MTKRHLTEPTPGPWLAVREDAEHVLIANTDDRSWNSIEHYVGRVRANNARLVAAAPELLIALRALRDWCDQNLNGAPLEYSEIILRADAAITKATAESE